MEHSDVRQQTSRLTSLFVIVAIFSIAMSWMESSTVAYLRTLVNRVEPYQRSPLPMTNAFGMTEIAREAATLVMLITVAWLAGKSWKTRLGFFMLAFGIWDIFYYLFLKIIVGWPHSLFDWDILFLIPLPWWGPVLSPMLISLVLIIVGSLLVLSEFNEWKFPPGKLIWCSYFCGIIAALYVFMADSFKNLGCGYSGAVVELPTQFNWRVFLLALLLMAMPVLAFGIRLIMGENKKAA